MSRDDAKQWQLLNKILWAVITLNNGNYWIKDYEPWWKKWQQFNNKRLWATMTLNNPNNWIRLDSFKGVRLSCIGIRIQLVAQQNRHVLYIRSIIHCKMFETWIQYMYIPMLTLNNTQWTMGKVKLYIFMHKRAQFLFHPICCWY